MLQQTRVATAIPYFKRWMDRFPTLKSLANAPQGDVLAAWEGLGYYGRARNLHLAAQIVMRDYKGELPGDPTLLCKLPGIGPYTSGAIASICFGLDEPAVDGNVRRVVARIFNISSPMDNPASTQLVWETVKNLIPSGHAGDINQALMDLGATICTPKNPICSRCPLQSECAAYSLGSQEFLPARKPKKGIPHRTAAAGVISQNERVLIIQRPQKGLLGGMWEFPGGFVHTKDDPGSSLKLELSNKLGVAVEVRRSLGTFKHTYTHFRTTLHAFYCALATADPLLSINDTDFQWVTPTELESYPMGKIDRQIANRTKEEREFI